MADPSLLAHMFVDKHDRHMPYYRQEAELERFGWPVPRSNMTRWQHECGNLVGPLVDAMWEQALSRSWFAMDATGTAIRGSPEYKRGNIFVLIAEAESVLFRFSPTYDAKTVNELFGGHAATILADASANHNVLFKDGSNREASCWACAPQVRCRIPRWRSDRAGPGTADYPGPVPDRAGARPAHPHRASRGPPKQVRSPGQRLACQGCGPPPRAARRQSDP